MQQAAEMIPRITTTMTTPLPISAPSSPGNHHHKKHKSDELSPVAYLRMLFGSACLNSAPKSFLKPKEEEIAAYDLETVRAIRSHDVTRLRQLYAEGRNLNACNQFGESLLHMACRRGDLEIVSFMIREAKVRVDISDDFGRNPFHDACWTSTPNFEVMDVLIEVADPVMLISEDVRGSTPFDYARREHYKKWVKYLEERKDILEIKINAACATKSNLGVTA
jgi:ankyrin repeat protein